MGGKAVCQIEVRKTTSGVIATEKGGRNEYLLKEGQVFVHDENRANWSQIRWADLPMAVKIRLANAMKGGAK